MSSIYEIHIPAGGSGGGPPPPGGQVYFAPKYLVGNVPNGDSAVAYNSGGFVYIPDPGDGTGIATALANGDGDVWARPGLYELEDARLVVPPGVRLWGSGVTTTIQTDGFTDNCAVEVQSGGEFAWCRLFHDAEAAGATGHGIVEMSAPGAYAHDLTIALGTLVTGLNGGIYVSGTGTTAVSRIQNITIGLPLGVGGGDINTWLAGIYGAAVTHVVQISNVSVTGGDSAILSKRAEMHIDTLFATGQSTVPVYSPGGFLTITGNRSTIQITRATVTSGIFLSLGAYEISSVRFINISGGAAIPAILGSGSDVSGVCTIHACEITSGFSPGISLDFMQDSLIYGNRINSTAGVVPVVLGGTTENCIVSGNVSRGSGGTLPTNAGTGNTFTNNIWGV